MRDIPCYLKARGPHGEGTTSNIPQSINQINKFIIQLKVIAA